MERTVKLGRKMISPYIPGVAQHWAVKVGGTWYEIHGKSDNQAGKSGPNKIDRGYGDAAPSGAGSLGGEVVGNTNRSEKEINDWIDEWTETNCTYGVMDENCQKFAYEFIYWLTNGVYTLPHRFDAALSSIFTPGFGGFTANEEGNAIARYGSNEIVGSAGPLNGKFRPLEFKAQAVAGPGLGAFGDASIGRIEGSVGNIVGAHVDLNVNTGVGVRNGNAEAHLLGFGAKIGADGVEINTPLGGVNACNIM